MELDRFTITDFEGSVERLIGILRKFPEESRLEVSEEIYRNPYGGVPEVVDILVVKGPER